MNIRRLALCCLTVLLLTSGCSREISGTYIAKDENTVCWLQLVRTPDNHLAGQLVLSSLNADGKIDRQSVALNGAIEGGNVTLTGGGFLGMNSTALSGRFTGNSLTLMGVGSVPINLKHSTLADNQTQLAELDANLRTMISARKAAAARERELQEQHEFATEIARLVNAMEKFDSEANFHLTRLPDAEKGYESTTAKVAEYISRERRLAGNQNAQYARSQLEYGADQASLAADQIHDQVMSFQSSFEGNIVPVASKERADEWGCHEIEIGRSTLPPEEIEGRRAPCARLLGAAPVFHQKYSAVASALGHTEEVYKHEKARQERLITAGQRIQ